MRKIFVLLTIFLLAVSGVAFADATGNWVLNMEGPMGPEEWKLNIKGDGSVDGEHPMLGPMPEYDITWIRKELGIEG